METHISIIESWNLGRVEWTKTRDNRCIFMDEVESDIGPYQYLTKRKKEKHGCKSCNVSSLEHMEIQPFISHHRQIGEGQLILHVIVRRDT